MNEPIEQLYKQVIENAGDAVIIAGSDGMIQSWNAAAERIFGFTAQEAMGQSLDIIIPENQRDLHWTGYDHVLESGETKYDHGDVMAFQALRSDGTRVGVEFSIVPLRGNDGVIGIAAILRQTRRRGS